MKRLAITAALRRGLTLCLATLTFSGVVTMCGCTRAKYTVDYGGQQSSYRGAKDAYRAGQTVRMYYDMIGTDTDYTFLLDGNDLNCTYQRNKGFLIRFVMPAHDVKLECRAYNSMVRGGEPSDVPDETVSAETECGAATEAPTEQTTRAPGTTGVPGTATTGATTAAPAALGEAPFTAQIIRTGSASDGRNYPTCLCVDSKAALDAYLSESAQTVRGSETALRDAVQAYDDDWFRTHQLLLVMLEAGSGSVRHTVRRVEKTAQDKGVVEIRRDVPQVGTCDMAYWHLLIELPGHTFAPTDTIEVRFTDS